MPKKSVGSKNRKIVFTIFCLLGLGIFYFLSPLLIGWAETFQLRSAFAEQSKIFSGPISSLGVEGQPERNFQCLGENDTHWQTEMICQSFDNYKYDPSPMTGSANLSEFEKLLQQNGWVNDRPKDPYASFTGAITYAMQNTGYGSEVPMHKNIGSISCNFRVDFDNVSVITSSNLAPISISEPQDHSANLVSVSINEFVCSQTVRFFMPHISTRQYSGP